MVLLNNFVLTALSQVFDPSHASLFIIYRTSISFLYPRSFPPFVSLNIFSIPLDRTHPNYMPPNYYTPSFSSLPIANYYPSFCTVPHHHFPLHIRSQNKFSFQSTVKQIYTKNKYKKHHHMPSNVHKPALPCQNTVRAYTRRDRIYAAIAEQHVKRRNIRCD